MELEQWLPFPGYEEGYLISDQGRVWSLYRDKEIFGYHEGSHYLYFYPTKEGKQKKVYIHTAVLTTFSNPPEKGQVCRHLNGDNRDNRLVNLAWGSYSENTVDQVSHGSHNNARKTHCLRGHEFTPSNTYLNKGRRNCRACRRAGYKWE